MNHILAATHSTCRYLPGMILLSLLLSCMPISRDELPPQGAASPSLTPSLTPTETPAVPTPTAAVPETSSPDAPTPSATPSAGQTPTPMASISETPGGPSPTAPLDGTPTASPSAVSPDPASPTPFVSPVPTDTPSPLPIDADGDGFPEGSDCDDTNPAIHPGAPETCNGIDDDCSGTADDGAGFTWYADLDRDDVGIAAVTTTACEQPAGYVPTAGDCDDTNPAIHPGAAETCNGIDDNCSGTVDEGLSTSTWYADQDGDGFGNASSTTQNCQKPSGFVADSSDCNDSSATAYPGAPEQCNNADDSCDGQIDENLTETWYQDLDGDGYGVTDVTSESCTQPSRTSAEAGDCNDSNANIHPEANEQCSQTMDQNCDGQLAPTCSSCAERHEDYPSAPSGVYAIDPDGVGGLGMLDVYCDMLTDGGGFTLLQRSVWDWTDGLKLNTGLEAWKTVTVGSASPGFAYRLKGTAWPLLPVEGETLLKVVLRRTNNKDCAPLFYQATGASFTLGSGTVTTSGLTGDSTTSVPYGGTELSTTDSGPYASQVSTSGGTGNWPIPWFYNAKPLIFPAYDENLWTDLYPHPAISSATTADTNGLTPLSSCAAGAGVLSSNGLYAASLMELYVR